MFPSWISREPQPLLNDDELQKAATNNKHHRSESLQSHFNVICIVGMYLGAIGAGLIVAALVVHQAMVGGWDILAVWLKMAGSFAIGYVVKHFADSGIEK